MNRNILISIVFCAFIARVFLIWIGRPEFVGWFNHTYYFYVQTRELLETGNLAFPDMPLLFHLYTATSKMLTWFGLESHSAIVNASRFWMCAIPALIPIPVYAILRNIYEEVSIPNWIWALVFVSAFYPLTLVHHPEFLQKNMLGLLLLALLMLQTKILIDQYSLKRVALFIIIFFLIILTHFGSAGAAILYVCAILISMWIHKKKAWSIKVSLGLVFGLASALLPFYFLDIQRFERISSYMYRIADSSILGLLFSANDPDKFTTIIMFLLPLGCTILFYRIFKKNRKQLSLSNSTFWLGNIIFFYLLLLPIYEPLLMARFVSYLTLPLIFIVVYTILNVIELKIWKRALVSLAVFGTLFIAAGDITSLFMHNKNKEAAYLDLLNMKENIDFSDKDLILTRNGAEHIANWFLKSKSSLITSFNSSDLYKYERIFIMNPTEGAMKIQSITNVDNQKYNYMLSNIEEPADAEVVYNSDHIKLIQIKHLPTEWKLDNKGNWIGYLK